MKILLSSAMLFISMVMNAATAYSLHRRCMTKDSTKGIEVGQYCPDFAFQNVTNTTAGKVTLSDYRGKLLIIDFWATWCSPCVHAMPENNRLQQQFAGKLQFLCVSNEAKQTVDAYFANTRSLHGIDLHLVSLYGDSTLAKYFPHLAIPHCVWIDGTGKVIAITESSEVTVANIEKALSGTLLSVVSKDDRHAINDSIPFFNERLSQPIFVHEGVYGPNKIRYRSVLTHYINNLPASTYYFTGRIRVNFGFITMLLRDAYAYSLENELHTVMENRLIMDVPDPSKYKHPNDSQAKKQWIKDNSYVYDLVLPDYYKGNVLADGPDSIRKYACEIMKEDIEGFSHLKCHFEKRIENCVVLKCVDSTKVNSPDQFGETKSFPGYSGAVFNYPYMKWLDRSLEFIYQNKGPFIDDTHYHGKVNLQVNADLHDVKAVNAELMKFGLQLVEEPVLTDMLVVQGQ